MKLQIRMKHRDAVWCSPMMEPEFHNALRDMGHEVVEAGADVVLMDSQLEIGEEPTILFCWGDCAEPPLSIWGTVTGRYDHLPNLLGYMCPTKGTNTITSKMWEGVLQTEKPIGYLTTMAWQRLALWKWKVPILPKRVSVGFVGLVEHEVEAYQEHRQALLRAFVQLSEMTKVSLCYTHEERPLSFRQQWEIIARCEVIVSPWGITELCWRDYEAVLAGAMIVKPQQDVQASLDPWDDKNTVYCKPDYSDLQEACWEALNEYSHRKGYLEAKRLRVLERASSYDALAEEFMRALGDLM